MSFAIKNDNTVVVIADCPICGVENRVELKSSQYDAWQAGAYIQNAAPNLTPEQREILISGICPKCWDKMWGSNE